MKETTTSAAEREKAGKMFELNEKYIVHSHFIGEKNINEVIGRLAFERAVKETLA